MIQLVFVNDVIVASHEITLFLQSKLKYMEGAWHYNFIDNHVEGEVIIYQYKPQNASSFGTTFEDLWRTERMRFLQRHNIKKDILK